MGGQPPPPVVRAPPGP